MFVGVVILIVIAISIYASSKKANENKEANQVSQANQGSKTVSKDTSSGSKAVCTQDAKKCPDGSYVGRTGPKCEFSKCPEAPSVPTKSGEAKIFKTVLGNGFFLDGVTYTPLQVLEDSRCPVGVTCAWAGKVRVSLKIETNTYQKVTQTSEISLTNSVVYGNKKITMLSMNPVPVQGKVTLPAEYSFEFSVVNK